MSIEVVEYDPAWPAQAAAAMAEVEAALGGSIAAIEHIGSTAVPGLAAKPIIDLMAAAAELSDVERREAGLLALGYRRHEHGMADRLLYVRGAEQRRTHHLRAHPADAERYAAPKWALAATEEHGPQYTRAKTDLIQELTDRARAGLGLPSVPVWEQ